MNRLGSAVSAAPQERQNFLPGVTGVPQGFFERPDLEAVVAALPAYLQDFTRFAYLTGWRKGEGISLKWTDVDRDAGAPGSTPTPPK